MFLKQIEAYPTCIQLNTNKCMFFESSANEVTFLVVVLRQDINRWLQPLSKSSFSQSCILRKILKINIFKYCCVKKLRIYTTLLRSVCVFLFPFCTFLSVSVSGSLNHLPWLTDYVQYIHYSYFPTWRASSPLRLRWKDAPWNDWASGIE